MKGWHKHGVCSRGHWIYDRKLEKQDSKLFAKRYEDAVRRPLGAYFRVNHKDLIAMHAAMTEVGILYATSQVHVWAEMQQNAVLASQKNGGMLVALNEVKKLFTKHPNAMLTATLARILGEATGKVEFAHHRSQAAQRRRREAVMQQTPAI